MSVIAHNIIAIILICVSKGRGRARGPVVPCVVGYPSPPRPCGSLCVFHVLWVIAPAPPPFAKARSLVGGRGHTVGNVDSYVDDVCLFVECGRGGGGHTMGGGACDAATRHHVWSHGLQFGNPLERKLYEYPNLATLNRSRAKYCQGLNGRPAM